MEPFPPSLPVLPIRNAVLFPTISMPLVVGRPRSLQALEAALASDNMLVVVTQRNLTPGDPDIGDLHSVGTLCKVENSTLTEQGARQIVVTGVARYRVAEFSQSGSQAHGSAKEAKEPNEKAAKPAEARGSEKRRGRRDPGRDERAEKDAADSAGEPAASASSESASPSPASAAAKENYLVARGEIVADTHAPDAIRSEALLNSLKTLSREILELLPGATEPLIRLIDRVDDAAYLTNVCAAYLNLPLPQKQDLLETVIVEQRMETLLGYMRKEREVLSLQREIRDKMSERINKAQREALLREQLKTIRAELGDEAGEEAADELDEKINRADLPEEAAKQALEELKRLRALPQASAEYHVVRTYLEWLAALPWKKSTQDNIDLKAARRILDEDHYGLENVKRRILQFLAVAKLKNDLHGPILCLVGPPGVGKTSLGQSIARTLGRKFIRASLGGVRDEAEIRGHRRTYVGAMPGRIIQSIKRVGTRNPLMMLDEIDKLRADFHGDPSAAMLEVLDPEQNKSFTDHYLDVPFDLSDVFFIATANVVDTIPGPLRDRMEIIEVNGYTTNEKLHIARNYLVPRELTGHGLSADQVNLPDPTLQKIITHYTREAGVRELRRKIAALFRAVAEEVVEKQQQAQPLAAVGGDNASKAEPGPSTLEPERLNTLLGPERFFPEQAERAMKPGVATGLAWTPHGGDLLFIEATLMPGKGKLILTGQLGDVMKESAQIAVSLARSSSLLTPTGFDFNSNDIHVHVPAGAIPKDGPSAGVTVMVALASLLLGRSIDPDIAMTGEITLRGAVLPVGGIKEKVLAPRSSSLSAF